MSGDTAVVIGHGNVALDVARILLTPIQLLKVIISSNNTMTIIINITTINNTFFYFIEDRYMFSCT